MRFRRLKRPFTLGMRMYLVVDEQSGDEYMEEDYDWRDRVARLLDDGRPVSVKRLRLVVEAEAQEKPPEPEEVGA